MMMYSNSFIRRTKRCKYSKNWE